ncbi:sulfite exporter TauE/SafE family protein, partial [Petrotoga halophila]
METLWFFIIVGFLAQVVDGALGMAYGTISNALLLSVGVPPAISSASVHFAEIFTTSISGFSHLKLGNVDKSLFKKLLIPGVIGGVLGAYILTN